MREDRADPPPSPATRPPTVTGASRRHPTRAVRLETRSVPRVSSPSSPRPSRSCWASRFSSCLHLSVTKYILRTGCAPAVAPRSATVGGSYLVADAVRRAVVRVARRHVRIRALAVCSPEPAVLRLRARTRRIDDRPRPRCNPDLAALFAWHSGPRGDDAVWFAAALSALASVAAARRGRLARSDLWVIASALYGGDIGRYSVTVAQLMQYSPSP